MTREEAIEFGKMWLELQEDCKDSYTYEFFKMAIKALEQEPRWIPVTEKLPEESTAVLVWCPERKNIYCAYYNEKHWWIFGAYWEGIEMKITAWMPLPQPYNKESGDEG